MKSILWPAYGESGTRLNLDIAPTQTGQVESECYLESFYEGSRDKCLNEH